MTERSSRWRDNLGEEVPCAHCGEVRDSTDLDRLLWCTTCVTRTRDRASRIGWMAGGTLALGLGLWIWTAVRPSDLVLGGWIATLVAAAWLGSKLAREIAFGVFRYRE